MKALELVRGNQYMHRRFGVVTLMGNHPHDGALYIVELNEENEFRFEGCKASDLMPFPATDPAESTASTAEDVLVNAGNRS